MHNHPAFIPAPSAPLRVNVRSFVFQRRLLSIGLQFQPKEIKHGADCWIVMII